MINHIITKKTFESCGVDRKSKTHARTHSVENILGKKRNFNFVNKHEPYNSISIDSVMCRDRTTMQ